MEEEERREGRGRGNRRESRKFHNSWILKSDCSVCAWELRPTHVDLLSCMGLMTLKQPPTPNRPSGSKLGWSGHAQFHQVTTELPVHAYKFIQTNSTIQYIAWHNHYLLFFPNSCLKTNCEEGCTGWRSRPGKLIAKNFESTITWFLHGRSVSLVPRPMAV